MDHYAWTGLRTVTNLLWDRKIEVEFRTVTLSEVLLEVNLKRAASEKPPEGSIDAYNLAPETVRQIAIADVPVVIRSGYGRNVSEIFRGFVTNVNPIRSYLDDIWTFTLGGALTDSELVNGLTNVSYSEPTFCA